MKQKKPLFLALLAGSALVLATPALADHNHPNNAPSNNSHPANSGWHRGSPGGNVHVNMRVQPFRFHNRVVVRLSPAERTRWIHGSWRHAWHNGRFGWWWWAGGAWYFYDTPTYPYPDYVSDTYYDDYDDYGQGPASGGGYWYWCNNPRGYYPYVQSCGAPWQPVPAGAGPQQSGPDMNGAAPDDNGDNGPPPGYGDQNGPPQGYDDQGGPPPDDQNGPPPGYDNGDQNGPPPGYSNGPDDQGQGDEDDDNGPDDQNGPPPPDQNGPPPGYSGSPQ